MFLTTAASAALLISSVIAFPAPAPYTQHATPEKWSIYANHFPSIQENATYDYIVVGGGSAGLAVASNLANCGRYMVAVIEAGGFYEIESGNTSVVPGYCIKYDNTSAETATQYPLVDWGFITTNQSQLGGRRLHYQRGKTLGGSSALNAMIYNRGTKGSFQQWADLVGDQSWTFENLLPYFIKSTNFTPANTVLRALNASVPLPDAGSYNTTGGPVHTSYSNFALPFTSWVQRAFPVIGIPSVNDFYSGKLLGSQYATSLIDPKGEVRASSKESYLEKSFVEGRTNLQVYTHTLAKRVLFAKNSTNATGVEVVSGSWNLNKTYVLSARREIIVSSGAFHSPQLLMLSGIGPKETLNKFNISVIADRPGVGQEMTDHWDVEVTYPVNVQGTNSLNDPQTLAKAIKDWNSAPSTGILTSAGADYIGWEKVPNRNQTLSESSRADLSKFPSDWPELEYEIGSVVTNMSNTNGYGTLVVVNVAPTSRGNVTIISNDTLDLPVINPNWLATKTDQEVTVAGIKRARQLFQTSEMAPVLLSKEGVPANNITTDADILNYAKMTGFQNWHAATTCRMGLRNDSMAVVDSKARVIGVQNLRVIDASSMALLPPGHPMSTVFVMSEKLSADILAVAA